MSREWEYKCKIMADMNAHVGTQPIGIEGNLPGINSNVVSPTPEFTLGS